MPPPSKRRRIREFVDAGVDNNKFTGSTSKRMLLQRIVREYEEVVRASSAVGQRNSSKGLKELLKESNALFEKFKRAFNIDDEGYCRSEESESELSSEYSSDEEPLSISDNAKALSNLTRSQLPPESRSTLVQSPPLSQTDSTELPRLRSRAQTSTAVSSAGKVKLKVLRQTLPPLRYSSAQQIPPKSKFNGSLEQWLCSFRLLTEEGVTEDEYDQYIRENASLRRAVAKKVDLNAPGGLSLPEKHRTDVKFTDLHRPPCLHNHLVSHAVYFSKLLQNERRSNLSRARKISGMIQVYFNRIKGADERQRREEERQRRMLAKRTSMLVKQRWKLVEKVVLQRRLDQIEEENKRLGKKQLNQILERSSELLGGMRSTIIGEDGTNPSNTAQTLFKEEAADHFDLQKPDRDISRLKDSDLSVEELRWKYASALAADYQNTEYDNGSGVDTSVANSSDSEENFSEPIGSELDSDVSEQESYEQETDANEDSDDMNKGSLLMQLYRDDEIDLGEQKAERQHSEEIDERAKKLYAEAMENRMLSESSEESSSLLDSEGSVASESGSDVEDISSSDAQAAEGTLMSFYAGFLDHDENEMNIPSRESSMMNDLSDVPEKVLDTRADSVDNVGQEKPIHCRERSEHEISQLAPPFLLRATLREYQLAGFHWLVSLYHSKTNGILADEMGLGKTIQTISLLAYLACEMQDWGPHLIIVPTSVMLNWEMEFKKFLPAFKILTYYGNPQQRKEKRKGWTNPNTFNVCVTSYQLVLHDQQVFRRKKWHYLVLDEAHNIKNFKSQRWQKLLTFNSEYRLLLTGTPLQNNLTELWSLLYFLMPHGLSEGTPGFADLKDFQDWFAKPVDMLTEEDTKLQTDEARQTVQKLHAVLRPYVLRRLKQDVEKQLPSKYEHMIYCKLSKRQRYLYDDFMSRAQTRQTLASGNFMSIINCLMQLRKVCNHPDLFEVRSIRTSFAQSKSAVSFYARIERLMRERLLEQDLGGRESQRSVNLSVLNIAPISNESLSRCNELRDLQPNNTAKLINKFQKGTVDVQTKDHGMKDITSVDLQMQNLGTVEGYNEFIDQLRNKNREERDLHQMYISSLRCSRPTFYGAGLIQTIRRPLKPQIQIYEPLKAGEIMTVREIYIRQGNVQRLADIKVSGVPPLAPQSLEERADQMQSYLQRFATITPAVVALDVAELQLSDKQPSQSQRLSQLDAEFWREIMSRSEWFHEAATRLAIAFPDKGLLQYDCGKLQNLYLLLRELIPQGHRALIFTQMTKMLDILEQFLNIHGWRYLRLDGATKIEQRQTLTERFNQDERIPIFILSTRSGGLGINLTGADTVIFYDSDWNPCMDRQCQDRCHRIGQVRDVHIYRLVSEYTIEENIVRKAARKSRLDDIVMGEGEFTTDFFNKRDIREMFSDIADFGKDAEVSGTGGADDGKFGDQRDVEHALLAAEDEDDAKAATLAQDEIDADRDEFSETRAASRAQQPTPPQSAISEMSETIIEADSGAGADADADAGGGIGTGMGADTDAGNIAMKMNEIDDDAIGHIDGYMIKFFEEIGTGVD